MVQLAKIQEENANVAQQKLQGQVAVFVGATAGIGESTLTVIARLLQRPRLYVVGRSAERFESQRKRLQKINTDAQITFIEADISRLIGVDRACKQITATENCIDYLFMSPGYLPLAGAVPTPDGIELCFQLSYHARIRFLHLLQPQLSSAQHPRVLSVLNGGQEGRLNADDLALEHTWTLASLVTHTGTLGTLAFDHFAAQNPHWTIVHAAPGLVRTDIARKPQAAADASLGWRLVFPAIRWLATLVFAVQGIAVEVSGARNANLLLSDRFGPGVWRVDRLGEVAPPSDVLEEYRREGWAQKTWDFTTDVWRRVLGDVV